MNNRKITIFLSHSHKDIDKVRKVRDILESLECEPLIFFLKCLDDRNEELEEFIKEEIKARSIFVYCKSSNSESSVWVKKELEYIKSFDNKRLYTIDIENDFSLGLITFLQQIANILKRNRIFISYSNKDVETIEVLRDYLEKNGYYTNDDFLGPDINTVKYSMQTRDKAIEEGIFIFIASSNSVKSEWCLSELRYAISKHGFILPIMIMENNGYNVCSDLPYDLQMIPFKIHRTPTEDELKNLIYHLKNIKIFN